MVQNIKNKYHLLVAWLACFVYGFPGKKLKIIGVTGTDGKTTTSHIIHHLLSSSGKKVSLVSSVHAEIGGKSIDTGFHVTTPDSFFLQKLLRSSVDSGDEYLVLEVTSHGLDQNRVWGIDFEIGVLTNVTHEHLDYHKTYRAYLHTKEKLLQKSKLAILNHDDESFELLNRSQLQNKLTYGKSKSAQINPSVFSFSSPLPGEYNEYNCLAAIAVCRALGLPDGLIRSGLKTFKGVTGRFEFVTNSQDLKIIIDFAHTPHAIESILKAIKPMKGGRLIHIFGSAAKRDRLKRPLMGANSAKFADFIVLTEEDYRDENVDTIIDEIAHGAIENGAIESKIENYNPPKIKKPIFFRIPDRQNAIDFAISKLAKKGDTIVLTGKAHEKSLARGNVEQPWSEHEAVTRALNKRTKQT